MSRLAKANVAGHTKVMVQPYKIDELNGEQVRASLSTVVFHLTNTAVRSVAVLSLVRCIMPSLLTTWSEDPQSHTCASRETIGVKGAFSCLLSYL
jgi:hypothetical protein